MRLVQKSLCLLLVATASLALLYRHIWSPKAYSTVDLRNRPDRAPEPLLGEPLLGPSNKYAHIPFRLKEEILELLPQNSCSCEVVPGRKLPFPKQLFGQLYSLEFTTAFGPAELARIHSTREQEYQSDQHRTQSPADQLLIVRANSPLEYPAQGVEVRPLRTILIPGLSLQAASRKLYEVTLTATLGTFNVAAVVEGVKAQGEGETRLSLSSDQLDNLNRQLQFVTYTNTLFHPNTADTVQFATDGHQASFTIRIRHAPTPKLYNPGSPGEGGDYNITALVSIATKTFLRYDKLRALIASIRRFYPTVTIIIADDSQHPEPVGGPHIEQYFMPFGKGWFAGRNLAISQVTTKYVLWVDDDFIFTPRTRVEKLVDVLEKTSLDLGAQCGRSRGSPPPTGRRSACRQGARRVTACRYARATTISSRASPAAWSPMASSTSSWPAQPRCCRWGLTPGSAVSPTSSCSAELADPAPPGPRALPPAEFFIDGLGVLHVGSCADVVVDHASKIKLPWQKTESEKQYAKFRYPTSADSSVKHGLFYFKNHFKCMTGN
ncbi:beta-1,4 N-acetylgalactosaminyltransferase 1 isoform X2 [Natator depressus]|uniref:beta-1,4 N-acetylgalactosaminyltransferase 1 isoform X2 n=1 Tax=Natator depressus TaxID=27790 RepID=UPI003EB70308